MDSVRWHWTKSTLECVESFNIHPVPEMGIRIKIFVNTNTNKNKLFVFLFVFAKFQIIEIILILIRLNLKIHEYIRIFTRISSKIVNVKSARFVSKYRMFTILVNKIKLIDKKVLKNVVVW